MSYSVFISYNKNDLNVAKWLEQSLLGIKNTTVFLADSTLLIGELSAVLIEKIKQCDLFIVVYSKHSQTSAYVQQEIGVAKGNGKLIIPILLDAEVRPDAMLTGLSYISFFDNEKNLRQLQQLYNYINQESQKKVQQQNILALGAILLLSSAFSKK